MADVELLASIMAGPAAGDLLSTGSLTLPTPLHQGQTYVAHFADLQVLSLNNLLFHRAPGEPGYSLLITINLLQLVGLYLSALGVRIWSGRSWLFSAVFAWLPWVLICGFWAWFAWRGVYLFKLPAWSRRIQVGFDWAWLVTFLDRAVDDVHAVPRCPHHRRDVVVCHDGAGADQRAQCRGHRDLPGLATDRVDARIEGSIAALERIDR